MPAPPRRHPGAGRRTGGRRRVRQRRLRAAGDRARRRRGRARWRPTGARLFSFKDQVIFEKSEVLTLAGRPSRCSRRTRTPGSSAWRPSRTASAPGRSSRMPRAVRRPAGRPPPAHAGRDRLRARPAVPHRGRHVGRAPPLFEDFLAAHAGLRRGAQLPGRQGHHPTCRCTCASARSRSATWCAPCNAADRQRRRRRRRAGVAVGADLARVLRADPVPPSARRPNAPSSRPTTPSQWESGPEARRPVRRLVRGPHRLSAGGRGHAQLNQTGYMHNRLRMVTASFLIKDLGIDWRWGERYFARSCSTTSTWPRTTAAGSGRRRPAATRSPTSASSIRSRSRSKFDARAAPSSAAICRSWPKLDDKEIHAPWRGRPRRKPAIRRRSSIMPRRARRRWSATRWSRATPSADAQRTPGSLPIRGAWAVMACLAAVAVPVPELRPECGAHARRTAPDCVV